MSTPIPGTEAAPVAPVSPEQQPSTPIAPVTAPEASQEDESTLPVWAREKIAKVNREAKGLRDRLHESEPLIAEAVAAREAQKTEAQKATERAQALEAELTQTRLLAERNGLAAQHAIPAEYHEMIVGSTAEERAASAAKLAALLRVQGAPTSVVPAGPPSQTPVVNLQSGASPTPPAPVPTEYPAHWTPHIRRKE